MGILILREFAPFENWLSAIDSAAVLKSDTEYERRVVEVLVGNDGATCQHLTCE